MKHPSLYPDDETLFDALSESLSEQINLSADPYSADGSYAAGLMNLPAGLRLMAATYHLDLSVTLDDIGWHFLNFGEPAFVALTERCLRELGLQNLADWFLEARDIVVPHLAGIQGPEDYYGRLEESGQMERIEDLTELVRRAGAESDFSLYGSIIFGSWVRYVREHPEAMPIS